MAIELPPEPANRISPTARWVWRAHWAGGSLVALALGRMAGDELGDTAGVLLWALPLAALVLGTTVVPELRWRSWRWEVREQEVDIRRGVLVVRRTLIPMPRVQHVEMNSDVLERLLELATVEVHTAAGSHTIPLLPGAEALALRRRIAALARTGDE